MSCDFGVWFPHERLSDKEAGEVYARLCEGDVDAVQSHPAVEAFYEALTAIHPEIDTIPEERIDDHDYCPWSCALDRSPAHVIMPCVWSQADRVHRLVHDLGRRHGLAVFDPQSGRITYPDSQPVIVKSGRPWWRVW